MPFQSQRSERDDGFRRYEYDDSMGFVGDLGAGADVSVDIVGDTAIVVRETPEGSDEREIELPDGEAKAFMKNGVVTVEVER